MFDGDTMLGESVQNHSVGAPRRPKARSREVTSADAARVPPRRARLAAMVVAVVAVVAVALAAVVTDGFGLLSGRSGPGPIVTPVSATVFSPGGSPDNPAQAELAIDGDAGTTWRSDTYVDATPFPVFKEGVGLILQLPEPTGIGAVTVELESTGTDVQIRSADSSNPGSLSATTELTSAMPVQPGENRIVVDDHTPTSYVLVWIPKLGTLDGQSRTEISEITVEAAN